MAYTTLADIYDPVKISKIIGDSWIKEARILRTNVAMRDARPNKGTQTYYLREKTFQDTEGQALKAGDTIASQKRTQTKVQHPVIWRYNSLDEPDVIGEIEEKDAVAENTTMANAISEASTQYLDNSTVAAIKGTGAVLTGNQAGTGAIITLAGLVDAKAKLGEKGITLDNGAMAMRSEMYYKMVKLGLVAATSNTFGLENQTKMVIEGNLPTNVLGLTPVISNKFAALGSDKFYIYFLGAGGLMLKGNDSPAVEVARKTAQREFATVTNFKISYGIGYKGVNWKPAGKEDVTDVELATAANWELSAADSNQVPIARYHAATV